MIGDNGIAVCSLLKSIYKMPQVEVGPFHLIPGYPAGIPSIPAGIWTLWVMTPRVPGYPPVLRTPGSIFFHNITRKLIQMSNRVVPEAIVDLYFLIRGSSNCTSSNRVALVVSVVVAVFITISSSGI